MQSKCGSHADRTYDAAWLTYRRATPTLPPHKGNTITRRAPACTHLRTSLARGNVRPPASQNTLRIEPSYADAHFNLGIAQQDRGDLAAAAAAYEAAYALDPTLTEAAEQASEIRRHGGANSSPAAPVAHSIAAVATPIHGAS